MKKTISLLIIGVLAGCAGKGGSWSHVYTSDHEEYDVYLNDEFICKSNSSCRLERRLDDGFILDARKDSVVYGRILVTKECQKNPSAELRNVNAVDKSLRISASVAKDGGVFGLLLSPLVLAGELAVWTVPEGTFEIPKEITIPIMAPESPPFPWDQPEK